MDKVIIIRWCEIHLKGKNRHYFEKLLEDNIKNALNDFKYKFIKISGRYLIDCFDESLSADFINKLKKVSGIHTISIAYKVKSDLNDIMNTALLLMKDKTGTFKVETRRADKKFELHSIECSRQVGGFVLDNNQNLKVDVHNPKTTLFIDVRECGDTLIYTEIIKGTGGMPIGSAGKGLLMVSGGIDSPVAGYMTLKRGMKIDCVHFHSYPYTGEGARQKVVDLCKILSEYSSGIKLHIVKFTEIQEAIHEKCPEEYMITIMRRFMFRISERLAKSIGAQAIITGESLGQVASQTIESITSSNSVIKSLPVLRPVIMFDKLEIIEISERIGTYETSILPYEDCCTVFLPKYPLIKPKLDRVIEVEKALNVEELIENAMQNIEVLSL